MPDFIQVPVPSHLVTAVMQFIVDRGPAPEGAVPVNLPGVGQGSEDDESRNWTREQLELLHASDAPSVRLFCEVLSFLADISPDPMPINEIGQHFGVKGITLQQTFGPVSRWMRKRMGGDIRWPIHFPAGGWAMNDHNASLWKQVTA